MLECSFKNVCHKAVVYSCNCTDPEGYFCEKHFTKHIKTTPGNHTAESMMVKLSQSKSNELMPKLKNMRKQLQGYRRSLFTSLKVSINRIQQEATKQLKKLKDLDKEIVKMLTSKSVNKDTYERIVSNSLEIDSQLMKRASYITEHFTSLFDSYDLSSNWKECNEVLFQTKSPKSGLNSINLDTFKVSTLQYAPTIQHCGSALKIDRNTYFLYGGLIGYMNVPSGEAYLLNLASKSYECLKHGPARGRAALVLKEKKIYIFSKSDSQWESEQFCSQFDLQTREWTPIQRMPEKCQGITAALLNQDIIITGYELDSCYLYNESGYCKYMKLPSYKNKLICDGWILADSYLYELDKMTLKWRHYGVSNIWDKSLVINAVFRKKDYFYFIDLEYSLMRINIISKTVEKISYS